MTESLVRTDSADVEVKGVPWLGGSSVVEIFFLSQASHVCLTDFAGIAHQTLRSRIRQGVWLADQVVPFEEPHFVSLSYDARELTTTLSYHLHPGNGARGS